MKIAFVSSEAVPFAKTGGLADVAGSLPKVLEQLGCEVKLFLPKYSAVDEAKFGLHYLWDIGEIPIRVNDHIRSVYLHKSILPDSEVEVYFIDCPHYYSRHSIYTIHNDEDERFILLCKAVIESLQRLQWAPDIIHCNDWQCGLIPLYLKDNYSWDSLFSNTYTVFTIHNMEYQGRFTSNTIDKAEIRKTLYYPGGPAEFQDTVSFMKIGIEFSDVITTVSKTYAAEILTPAFGAGLQDVLKTRQKDLYGIINGIDYSAWDPQTDSFLPYNFCPEDLTGKEQNKKYLLDHIKMQYEEDIPLIGIVSRLVEQKGFDLFLNAVPDLLNLNARWVILGSGEDKYENLFRQLHHIYPDKFFSHIGFNTELSHIIEAASDLFLMPSRYEPCGLNQIYSLKYGTVPVVRKTGGLADTVQDWDEAITQDKETGTGFTFEPFTPSALISTLNRALKVYQDQNVWRRIQLNGMKKDYSWKQSAREYLSLYKQISESNG
jgi:starch synthase